MDLTLPNHFFTMYFKKIARATMLLVLTLIMPSLSFSDTFFGIYAGLGFWKPNLSGSFATIGDTNIDLESDLGLNDDDSNQAYFAIEHFIPLAPNIKLYHTQLTSKSISTLDESITFNNETFSTNSSITAEVDFTHTDATFYYELLDNWINLDLGLTMRVFNGHVLIQDNTTSTKKNLDETLPLIYAAALLKLPFSGWHLGTNLNTLYYDDNQYSDSFIFLGYESPLRVGLQLGYRHMMLDIDELDNLQADINLKGIYGALTLHF